MLIDTHPHIISEDTVKYPITPLGGKRSKWSEERGAYPLEKLLEGMKKAGVDKAVVVHSSTTYGYDCSYLADSIAKHPGLLWGVGSVDFMKEDAIEKIEYWMNERKLCGFRFFSDGSTHDVPTAIDDPRTFPVYDYLQEKQIPLVMQIKKDGLARLVNLMPKFPKLHLVIDHAGKPRLDDGYPYSHFGTLIELRKYEGVHLKISSNFLLRNANEGKSTPQDFMRAIVDCYGADRIMWGSNCPTFTDDLSVCVNILKDACTKLTDEERAAIYGKTTERFYYLY